MENLNESISELIDEYIINEHIKVIESMKTQVDLIEQIVDIIVNAYNSSKKVMVCGNGGSAVDAEHFVGELTSGFQYDRKGLPAIALSSNTAVITAIANDYSYDSVFSRQVKAFGNAGDIVIGITTSGSSKNVINALNVAKDVGCYPILITGDRVVNKDFLTLAINSKNTARIQEAYILAIHIICERVEERLFPIE